MSLSCIKCGGQMPGDTPDERRANLQAHQLQAHPQYAIRLISADTGETMSHVGPFEGKPSATVKKADGKVATKVVFDDSEVALVKLAQRVQDHHRKVVRSVANPEPHPHDPDRLVVQLLIG